MSTGSRAIQLVTSLDKDLWDDLLSFVQKHRESKFSDCLARADRGGASHVERRAAP
jgi:hypothetical protein